MVKAKNCSEGPHHHENCSCDHHGQRDDNHSPISISVHENSTIGSYKFSIVESFEISQIIISELLKKIAEEIHSNGGIVGHIKAIVTQNNSCMISITDDESQTRHLNSGCHVEGVAIVFSIDPDQLNEILFRAFNPYLQDQ